MLNKLDRVFRGDANALHESLVEKIHNEQKHVLITANPEVFMWSKTDDSLSNLMLSDFTTISADGIGIVKAIKSTFDVSITRTAGIDSVKMLLSYVNSKEKSLFVYGATQEVLDKFNEVLKMEYPNINILGLRNGYISDVTKIKKDILELEPDLVLVALGVPRQEKYIASLIPDVNKGLFVGCGGSIDVLSGAKKRAPKLFTSLNLEWLYRIAKEPKRITRFYKYQIKFLLEINNLNKRGH